MNQQPTMVHQQPIRHRRMGVSIGSAIFRDYEAAQTYIEIQSLDSRLRRMVANQQPAMAGGEA